MAPGRQSPHHLPGGAAAGSGGGGEGSPGNHPSSSEALKTPTRERAGGARDSSIRIRIPSARTGENRRSRLKPIVVPDATGLHSSLILASTENSEIRWPKRMGS